MPEPVEVAIESALLTRAQAFATTQGIAIALPNVAFTPPEASPTAKWLRTTFLPAPSFETGIAWNAHNQHYGLMQLDVFMGQGSGEYAPGRLASAAITYFAQGTVMTKDGVSVRVTKQPYRGPIIVDGSGWRWCQFPFRTCVSRGHDLPLFAVGLFYKGLYVCAFFRGVVRVLMSHFRFASGLGRRPADTFDLCPTNAPSVWSAITAMAGLTNIESQLAESSASK